MTDAPIIDFMARLRDRAGPAAFMHCPECEAPDLAVLIRWRGDQPFIACLVCEACTTEIGIRDGTPVGWIPGTNA
ncbi:hypothetical protein GXW77_10750 [Roseomonas alkaliterrae]|jgi:hypothetical protein|uniref:hypothetical protein n=1 Tax=Neoroseomonas alkaliterrae TaxID=1452450 RepID=UPI001BA496A1|nr:hypothetical protein [Neoroseomonas alkaliterrae]MBR0676654.1 hypothetical protein [Neoroseomonas alkaliterrae]